VLEAALSRSAYGRVDWWHQEVLAALGALEDVTRDEAVGAAQPDSLLSDIAFSQPRLRNRVRGVRSQYSHLQDAVTVLRRELEHATDEETDVADVRQRLAGILTAFRHQRAQSTSSTRPIDVSKDSTIAERSKGLVLHGFCCASGRMRVRRKRSLVASASGSPTNHEQCGHEEQAKVRPAHGGSGLEATSAEPRRARPA
jgi:hypothetical protein